MSAPVAHLLEAARAYELEAAAWRASLRVAEAAGRVDAASTCRAGIERCTMNAARCRGMARELAALALPLAKTIGSPVSVAAHSARVGSPSKGK